MEENLFKKIEIVFEDEDFLAINKPAGLLVHSINEKNDEKALVDWLLEKYPEVRGVGDSEVRPACQRLSLAMVGRPGIIHRLDRETSGIMLIAKNNLTFDYLKNLFQEREIKKIYKALVYGQFKEDEGMIDKPIGIIKSSVKRSTEAKNMREIKEAITEYKVMNSFADKDGQIFSLLEVYPKTGRTNQIRVHLSSIKRPIVGDKVYAPKGWLGPNKSKTRMFLHAFSLEFNKPDGSILKLKADLPQELKNILGNI